jgi:hypothetical protein
MKDENRKDPDTACVVVSPPVVRAVDATSAIGIWERSAAEHYRAALRRAVDTPLR